MDKDKGFEGRKTRVEFLSLPLINLDAVNLSFLICEMGLGQCLDKTQGIVLLEQMLLTKMVGHSVHVHVHVCELCECVCSTFVCIQFFLNWAGIAFVIRNTVVIIKKRRGLRNVIRTKGISTVLICHLRCSQSRLFQIILWHFCSSFS